MTKILLAFIMLFTSVAHAQKTVQVFWPFSNSSLSANMTRSIIDSANTQQNKYQFVFVHKPGAGGSIAANSALESKDLSIVATTSSFYIRPLLYKDSHDVDNFNLVTMFCTAQPLAIFSKKITNLNENKNKEVTIGIIPGSVTTLVTRTLKRENSDIKILEVPYKGTLEATTDMLGGHIDGSVDFIGSATISRLTSDVKVVGMTGRRLVGGYPTFQSMNIRGLEDITVDHFYFVNKSIDAATRQELHTILTNAYNEKTKSFCEDDFGQLVRTPFNQVDMVHQRNKQKWEKMTAGIVKE